MARRSIIGFDLGGTKCSVGRFDAETLRLDAFDRFPTDAARGFDAVFASIVESIRTMQTPDTIAIGFGAPGLVRYEDGVLVHAPNIPGAVEVPLRAKLEDAVGIPVALENDANCFTLAEATMGAGKGKSVVVGITLGTGVGGGIVIHGTLFRGARGFAGEIGHMLLMPGKPPFDTANKHGDVEQFLSGTAMGSRCPDAKRPADYLTGDACAFLRPSLITEIAWLCASITHLLDPSVIVFGGSAGKALTPHLGDISHQLPQWVLPHTPLPELAVATTEHPDTLGAALSARALMRGS